MFKGGRCLFTRDPAMFQLRLFDSVYLVGDSTVANLLLASSSFLEGFVEKIFVNQNPIYEYNLVSTGHCHGTLFPRNFDQ